jgi:hypothetical protein
MLLRNVDWFSADCTAVHPRIQISATSCFYFFGFLFDTENGDSMFLRNYYEFLPGCRVSPLLIVTAVRTSDPVVTTLTESHVRDVPPSVNGHVLAERVSLAVTLYVDLYSGSPLFEPNFRTGFAVVRAREK